MFSENLVIFGSEGALIDSSTDWRHINIQGVSKKTEFSENQLWQI